MSLSLGFGLLMLIGKVTAWWITGSAAILSDALESIVHVIAVAFAVFSLWLSQRTATDEFPYGYERITFFSAGFEGGMIVLAAFAIIYTAIDKWLHGLQIDRLGTGALLVAAAAAINAALGAYLIRTGKKNKSLILEANGKHVLTDVWTSLGVIVGLCLVLITGWKPFDPICAILVALNILWSGGDLIWRSAQGLLDRADPAAGRAIRTCLDDLSARHGFAYHGLRFRSAGHRLFVDVHLLFPSITPLGSAHTIATEVEGKISTALDVPSEILTHLESAEDHARQHGSAHSLY
jgi:cation diffusion facilitator family transporter